MRTAFLLSTLLSLGATLVLAQTPSGVPSCYVCPGNDQLGFGLGVHYEREDGNLFCSYPAVEGEDPNDFFCVYSPTTGALLQDNDAGLCQPGATSNCASKRANIVRMMEERRLRRAAAAAPPTLDPTSPDFDEQVAKMNKAGRPWVEGS